MAPLTPVVVDTVIVDVPPHGISLSTASADRPAPPTVNGVSLET